MQLMQDIAKKHGLRCLLHEKPFAGVNGSGKHNNWSVVTNTGVNLFDPGDNPVDNLPFLATLACTIKAVDEYADLLRMTIATAGNDHRLGANEAPPAIISMFLGEELDHIIESITDRKELEDTSSERFQTGVSVIPDFSKDNTDRNRTSPFAFTGNKFEFRGVGSSQSIAGPNTILNAILAAEMEEMADLIESGKTPMEVIKDFMAEHKRIIFNGDGYSAEWEAEAQRRGLPNRKNTVDAMLCLKDEKNIEMLSRLGIYSEVELDSRYEILLDNYNKTIQVEALTASKMARNEIYPAAIQYLSDITKTALEVKQAGVNNEFLMEDVQYLSELLAEMKKKMDELDSFIKEAQDCHQDILQQSILWRDHVFAAMNSLRETVDVIETRVDAKYWPIPTYLDLLFGI